MVFHCFYCMGAVVCTGGIAGRLDTTSPPTAGLSTCNLSPISKASCIIVFIQSQRRKWHFKLNLLTRFWVSGRVSH